MSAPQATTDAAAARTPLSFAANMTRGREYCQRRSHRLAIGAWDAAFAPIRPLLTALANNLAFACLELNEPARAAAFAWLAAVAQDESGPVAPFKAWQRLALALERLGESRAALFAAEQAVGRGALEQQLLRPLRAVARKEKVKGSSAHQERNVWTDPRQELLFSLLRKAQLPVPPESAGIDSLTTAQAPTALLLASLERQKAHGNELVQAGRAVEAVSVYAAALSQLRVYAEVLTQRADCHCHLVQQRCSANPQTDLADALAGTQAALALDPTNLQAHCIRVWAVLEHDPVPMEEARAAFAVASTLPASAQAQDALWQQRLTSLQSRLAEACHGAPSAHTSQDASGPLDERHLLRMTESLVSRESITETRRTNEEHARYARAHGYLDPIDARVSRLHEEYRVHGEEHGFPVGVSPPQALLALEQAYESARSVCSREPDAQEEEGSAELHRLMLMRLGDATHGVVDWWLHAKIGDLVFPFERIPSTMLYTQEAAHSYSNFMSWPIELHADSVHVAVGFVDLGQLSTCRVVAPAASGQGSTSVLPPARWIGFESAVVPVAKCRMLLRLLQQPRADDVKEEEAFLESLLQIWYSASWSPCTLQVFHAAVDGVLTQETCEGPVNDILRHWSVAEPVSLGAARASFTQDLQFLEYSMNFRQLADRLALCSYAFTRDLLPAGNDWVGNATMFALPGPIECAPRESVLNVLPRAALLEERARTPDVIAAAAACLRAGVQRARDLLMDRRVVAEVRLGTVTLESPAATAIRQLQPTSLSWSNICDYMAPAAFHALLRSVSRPGAGANSVHSFYTMNWMRGIKGAYYIDYPTDKQRNKLLDRCLRKLQSFAEQQPPLYRELLLQPPIDNRWNICTWPLAMHFWRRWLDAYFAPARSGCADLASSVEVLHPPYNTIFGRNAVTIGLQLAYPQSTT